MDIPEIDQPHETLFRMENVLEEVIRLLRTNRSYLTNTEKQLARTREAKMLNTDPFVAAQLDRQLYTQSRDWLYDYLKRKELLQLFTEADENLRKAQNYLKGFNQ